MPRHPGCPAELTLRAARRTKQKERSRASKDRANEAGANVSRRDMLVAAGALATLAAAGPASAAGEHDHSTHAPKSPELLDALEARDSKGLRCVSHCLVSFQEGDTSLADCAAKVHEMLAACSAMATLVASNSSYAAGMAKVCAEVCTDCAAECKKHAGGRGRRQQPHGLRARAAGRIA